ncbi:5-dehydro-4-deoxyglucarate dehydratase [Bacillus sp. FJAT-44742]|uniref:5-dehydro-4-deoxyglucarate dehydratase n=1 Tax=Bacillus sp. FJAT-44742 TaxID=2014005 RepID=UPI000C23C689|nr:5-dehydro-4-deoxyglucarate dehydratase [Bacillus sp. FJAT-44742]
MAERNNKFPKGILGFPVTPFRERRYVDFPALERNIEFLIDEKVSAVFVACGAGEFQSITEEEYCNMVELAVKTAKGRVPVYTGVGGNIELALDHAKVSEELGADGYLILPPYLIDGEQEGMYQYYETIISSTSLNAIMYQRNNAVANLDTVTKLAELPQLVGLKDGVGNMELNIELTQHLGNRLEWMNGMPLAEVTMQAYYPLGFDSYSSAISNYIPHISRLYFDSLVKGDTKQVNALYKEVILPINEIRKQKKGYAVSLIKAGMDIVGFPVGQSVRPPVIPVETEHYQQLKKIINKALEKYPKEEHQGLV